MDSESVYMSLINSRVEFESKSEAFTKDDKTPVTKHDLYVYTQALIALFTDYAKVISSIFPKS